MDLNEAIRNIIDGEAILFTGSGFSADAWKENGEKLCTARTLSHKLLSECGFAKEDYVDDLGQASEIYKSERGTAGLVEFLKNEFTAEGLTDEQRFIANLPWLRIYTTNYDNVLQKARDEAGNKLNIAVLSDRQSEMQDKCTLCVCLNGSLARLSEDKLSEEIKLTNSSYLTDTFRSSPWLSFFQTDLKSAKAIFFIGYSMQYDLDIQRIVFMNEELREKTFFIMYEKEPKANTILVKRFGQAFPIGQKAFVEAVKSVQKDYVHVKTLSHPLLCFEKVEITKAIPKIADKEVIDLFLKGSIDGWDKVYYSLTDPDNVLYCVHRTMLNQTLEQIKDGEKNFVFHSSLGNGKTLYLMSLAAILSRNGYKVYYYQRYRSTLPREIEQVCHENGAVAFIFDRYSDCLPYLETLKAFRGDQILIVADRSALNDINYGKIAALYGEFITGDLNALDDAEVEQLCKLFTRYGLWGDKAGLREDEKFDLVARVNRRSMGKTILQLLRSPNILDRYKTLIQDIRHKESYYEALIYILVSRVAEFDVDTDDLVIIFDASQLNSPSFRGNASVREFIDFDGNRVKGMSSLFASVLLEEIFDTGVIIDVMLEIFKRLNEQRARREVRQVLKKMMNFSNLQHVLNKNDKKYKENLLYYYDSIHTLAFCAENPHFWMQYAILKLSEYDYVTANLYFNNAYSFAKRYADFDTYQIDNHHARFILENEVLYGAQSTCMQAFKEAHSILMNPKHKVDSYYYPYRVAIKYYPFYEKFFGGMNKKEQEAFMSACEEMLNRIEWYLSATTTREGRGYVLKAKEFISLILNGK